MILTLLAITVAQPDPDQTADVATVAAFVAAVRRNDREAAEVYLVREPIIGDRTGAVRTTFEVFSRYAQECRLSSVETVATTTRLPVSVDCSCGGKAPDRHASFWFEGEKISRIALGPRPMIHVPPVEGDPK